MLSLADTLTVVLLWTNPGVLAQTVVVPPTERATPADSLAPSCDASAQQLFDLDSAIVYAYPLHGGGFRRAGAKSVRGRESLPDSIGPLVFPGWTGARFYVVFRRIGSTRESCPSNFATKINPAVTGVEQPPPARRVVVEQWFDPFGRRLSGPTGTGRNFVRWTVNGRFIGSQAVPVIRGRVPDWFVIRRPRP